MPPELQQPEPNHSRLCRLEQSPRSRISYSHSRTSVTFRGYRQRLQSKLYYRNGTTTTKLLRKLENQTSKWDCEICLYNIRK
ncbi:unnamed protein product [Chrysodeixis includens]|uniref:Uncharacterized protein n=1 Tax=Chrysodeixis includens TaxID=689277 RepID=A0A9P0FP73_CHRIL|nr:unnamed protein product [Chrysodeixis includens]